MAPLYAAVTAVTALPTSVTVENFSYVHQRLPTAGTAWRLCLNQLLYDDAAISAAVDMLFFTAVAEAVRCTISEQHKI